MLDHAGAYQSFCLQAKEKQRRTIVKNKSIRHWVVVALMCGLAGGSIGICSNTVGVFYAAVAENLGVLRGTVALQSTLSLMVTGLFSLLVPQMMKRVSNKLMLSVGLALAVCSTAAMAYSSNIPVFFILGILRGIGAAVFGIVPVTMIINNWFEEKHGLVTSLALSFSGVAGAVFSPILNACIERFGWRVAYLIQAAILFVLVLPALIVPYSVEPRSMKLLPYGYTGAKQKKSMPNQKKSGSISAFDFFSFAVFALFHASITGFGQHMTGFAKQVGLAAHVGAVMMSCAMIGNIGTKLAIGWLSDCLGSVRASVCMIALNAAALLMMFAGGRIQSQFLLLTGAVCYGSVYAVAAVGMALLTKHFFGIERYPALFAQFTLINNIGASLALSLIGYIYDFTGSYDLVFWGAAAIHLIDLVLIGGLVLRRKQRLKIKESLCAAQELSAKKQEGVSSE